MITQFNHMVNTMVQYNGNEVNKCCEISSLQVQLVVQCPWSKLWGRVLHVPSLTLGCTCESNDECWKW